MVQGSQVRSHPRGHDRRGSYAAFENWRLTVFEVLIIKSKIVIREHDSRGDYRDSKWDVIGARSLAEKMTKAADALEAGVEDQLDGLRPW
jgi:hypothetical protein